MATQFLHIDTAARQVPKKATVHQWCVREIAAEAARNAAASRHVAVSRPPIRIFGVPPQDLPSIVDERLDGARDSKGRKIRKDAKVLLAGVVSFPMPLDSVERSQIAAERYRAWARVTVAWLRKEYGPALVCVIAHHDENYPHFHFFAVPDFRAGKSMADLHAGMHAIAGMSGGKREKDRAYKTAMRGLQERFWNDVGRQFDHRRMSTRPRRRWRYREWKEIQAYTKTLENRLARLTKAYERLLTWASTMTAGTRALERLLAPKRERQR
jgi:hypothetical protein